MVLPGDSILPWPSRQATRAVTIEAPSSAVWPWLVQAGYGRGGWYADMPWWRDPEGHRGRGSSSGRLIPEEQHIAVGQVLLDGPGCDETTGAWQVRTIRPGSALVLFSSRTLDGREVLPGSAPHRVYFDCSWAFVLRPLAGATRLIVRTRVRLHPDNRPFRWLAGLFAVGDQAMQRAMLLGIKRRVEDTLVRTSGRPGATRASAGTVRGIHDHQTAVSRSRHRGGVRPRGLRGGPQPGVRQR